MSEATQRLDASVARIAKDVGDIVERIRGNVGTDGAAILADCDRLDALSEAIEGIGQEETPPASDASAPSETPAD